MALISTRFLIACLGSFFALAPVSKDLESVCSGCHEGRFEVVCAPAPDDASRRAPHPRCDECHRIDARTVDLPIAALEKGGHHFSADPASCARCHAQPSRNRAGKVHVIQRRIDCMTCHRVHREVPEGRQVPDAARTASGSLKSPEPQLCGGCHIRVASRFQLASLHNIFSGKLVCTSCHPPHEERILTASRVGVSTFCGRCHPGQAASLYFHTRGHHEGVIGCLDCHDPHGSSNASLLKYPVATLCKRCHR